MRAEPQAPSVDLAISQVKIDYIVQLAREIDAKVAEADASDDADDDNYGGALDERDDDPTRAAFTGFIDDLNEDEQIEIVALYWVGRGTYSASEWAEAVSEARRERVNATAGYLLGAPLLAVYLEEGVAAVTDT